MRICHLRSAEGLAMGFISSMECGLAESEQSRDTLQNLPNLSFLQEKANILSVLYIALKLDVLLF